MNKPIKKQESGFNQIEDTRLLKIEYLHPKYWGVWFFVGFLFISQLFPFKVQWQISRGLAWLTYNLAKSRRRIAEVNVDICFPELSAKEKDALVKEIFHENMQGYLDSGTAWFGNYSRFKPTLEVRGKEHFDAVLNNGQGVVMAGAHFSILDLAGALTSLVTQLNVTYRPLDNKLMNAVMMKGRYRFCSNAYHKKDVKGFINCLKRGEMLWYAPDQDYGRKRSMFLPFFHVKETATTTGTLIFTKQPNVASFVIYTTRNTDGSGYKVTISPQLENFPSGDDEADLIRVNKEVEHAVRQQPEQYLWMHRRFKTRPNESDASLYD